MHNSQLRIKANPNCHVEPILAPCCLAGEEEKDDVWRVQVDRLSRSLRMVTNVTKTDYNGG